MNSHHRLAFTLIELLVVITIIVVLLALLTPALDRAIYQAELTLDGTHLKGISSGYTQYAVQNNRAYPQRHVAQAVVSNEINDPWWDNRPVFAAYMSYDMMADVLSEQVDLSPDASDPDALIFSGYALYAGAKFTNTADPNGGFHKPMNRLGDRWTFINPGSGLESSFSVLAGCRDARADIYAWSQTSHPDEDGKLHMVTYQNAPSPWEIQGAYGVPTQYRVTFSWWEAIGGDYERGKIDTNFTFADGSVARYNGVQRAHDERMADVPEYFDGQNAQNDTGRWLQTPPR